MLKVYSEKTFDLLESEEWPPAVDPALLKQTAEQRAKNILEIYVGAEQLARTKKFLDYGCGDGLTVGLAKEYGVKVAIGYDPYNYSGSVTTDFASIASRSPYDIILMHDVLDHLRGGETMDKALTKTASLLKREGKIILICHPYCGRNGTHLAQTLNKAFAHLLVRKKRLSSYGFKGIPTWHITQPSVHYKRAIEKANLAIGCTLEHRKEVEPFFHQILLKHSLGIAESELEICTSEFILTKKDNHKLWHNPSMT